MSHDRQGVTRRTFLGTAAAAAAFAGAPLPLRAQRELVPPPEIATSGRPQGTDKFGASVDGVPIIDAHIHLFDGRRTQGAGYMGSAAYRAQSQISLPSMYASLSRASGGLRLRSGATVHATIATSAQNATSDSSNSHPTDAIPFR